MGLLGLSSCSLHRAALSVLVTALRLSCCWRSCTDASKPGRVGQPGPLHDSLSGVQEGLVGFLGERREQAGFQARGVFAGTSTLTEPPQHSLCRSSSESCCH